MKKCNRCGEELPLDSYRKYPNGKPYGTCETCLRIDRRYRYLIGEEYLSPEKHAELGAIKMLYDMQEARGLKTPRTRAPSLNVIDEVNKRMKL